MAQSAQISVKDANGSILDVATLTAIAALIGEVQASPTANTLLARLKDVKAALPATIGPVTKAGSLSITLASDQVSLPVNQVSSAYDVATGFARPADTTAYFAGDVVGGALNFAAAGPAGGAPVMIVGAQLEIDVAAIPAGMGGFKLYLYSATPPSALADNAPFDLAGGDRATFLGFVDLGSPSDLGSTLYAEVNGINKQVKLASANVFGYLVTSGAFTPGSADAFKVSLHTVTV